MKKQILFSLILLGLAWTAKGQQIINENIIAGGDNGIYWKGFKSTGGSGIWGFQQNETMFVGVGGNVYNRGFSNNAMGIFNGQLNKEDIYLYNQNSSTADFIVLKSTGFVGIGVVNPYQQLSITGGIGFANQNCTDKKLYSPVDGTLEWLTHDGAGEHGFAVSHQGERRVYLNTNGNSYILGGNLGIGIATPYQQLSITGGIGFANQNCTDKKLYSPVDGTLEWLTHDGAREHGFAVSHQGERRVYLNTNGDSYFVGGKLGIGITSPAYELDVKGTIRATEIKVCTTQGCDFVFNRDYKLMNLQELEKYVTTNQHLPEIAPEKEMVENGVNIKDLQMKLLQKIEELTLYTIEQNKKIEQQNQEITELKKQNKSIEELQQAVKLLKEKIEAGTAQ